MYNKWGQVEVADPSLPNGRPHLLLFPPLYNDSLTLVILHVTFETLSQQLGKIASFEISKILCSHSLEIQNTLLSLFRNLALGEETKPQFLFCYFVLFVFFYSSICLFF